MLDASKAQEEGDEDSFMKVMAFFLAEQGKMIRDLRESEGDAFALDYLEWLVECPDIEPTISVMALEMLCDEFDATSIGLLRPDAQASLCRPKRGGREKLSVVVTLCVGVHENDDQKLLVLLKEIHDNVAQEARGPIKYVIAGMAERLDSARLRHLASSLGNSGMS